MTFKSKVDGWLLVVAIGVPVVALLFSIAIAVRANRLASAAPAIAITVLVIAFIAIIFANTNYRIDGNQLRIRSGFFKWTVPIHTIESVERTRNPLSSPALSLDRIAIRYEGGKLVMISPADQGGFHRGVDGGELIDKHRAARTTVILSAAEREGTQVA